MKNQDTIESLQRYLKIMGLLIHRPHSAKEMIDILNCSKSQVYVDIGKIKELGYPIENTKGLIHFSNTTQKLSKLNKVELDFLAKLLTFQKFNQTKEIGLVKNIISKFEIDNYIPTSENIILSQYLSYLFEIQYAIEHKLWLRLIDYHSTKSNKLKTKTIFPTTIETKGYFTAYDEEYDKVVDFKIERITQIETISDKNYIPQNLIQGKRDIFGMTGHADILIDIDMTERAYSLFITEFPGNERLIKKNLKTNPHFSYNLRIKVSSYQGVGRFILGLPTEIKINESAELRGYLTDQIKNNTFSSEIGK